MKTRNETKNDFVYQKEIGGVIDFRGIKKLTARLFWKRLELAINEKLRTGPEWLGPYGEGISYKIFIDGSNGEYGMDLTVDVKNNREITFLTFDHRTIFETTFLKKLFNSEVRKNKGLAIFIRNELDTTGGFESDGFDLMLYKKENL